MICRNYKNRDNTERKLNQFVVNNLQRDDLLDIALVVCDVPTTLLLYNCVFAYVNDKFTYFFVCALLFGFLMIEPLLR